MEEVKLRIKNYIIYLQKPVYNGPRIHLLSKRLSLPAPISQTPDYGIKIRAEIQKDNPGWEISQYWPDYEGMRN
jgi:hypothetical protein